MMIHQEIHYQLLTLLTKDPDSSQRQLAATLGISLGKVNYCLKALVDANMIQPELPAGGHGSRAPRRGPVKYQVTERGHQSRMDTAAACLRQKSAQLKVLTHEIELLQGELGCSLSCPDEESESV
ncbi:MAG: winged helix-turn-helix transcriptional regulator [Lysobacterales bacterium]